MLEWKLEMEECAPEAVHRLEALQIHTRSFSIAPFSAEIVAAVTT